MSGGSMDYLCYKVEDAAEQIPDIELAALCKDFGKLLHDIEWYTSGDTSVKDYTEAVNAFKTKWFKIPREERLKTILDAEFEQLKSKFDASISNKPFEDKEY